MKVTKLEISYADLERAMCTAPGEVCVAHKESARKLWERLEKIGGLVEAR